MGGRKRGRKRGKKKKGEGEEIFYFWVSYLGDDSVSKNRYITIFPRDCSLVEENRYYAHIVSTIINLNEHVSFSKEVT